MRTPRDEQHALEEERRAIEEDRTRYDSVMPGFSAEARSAETSRAAAASPRDNPDAPPAVDRGRATLPGHATRAGVRGPSADRDDLTKPCPRFDVQVPDGLSLGPNLQRLVSRVAKSDRPRDVDSQVVEHIVLESLRNSAPRRVPWLWPGRIPLGKLTMLVGDPNVGKSLFTLDLAARVTRGLPLPDRPTVPSVRGQVLLLTSEDTSRDTIVPRLEAAGADMTLVTRLHSISGKGYRSNGDESLWNRPIILPDDIQALESYVQSFYKEPEEITEYRNGEFVPTGKKTRPDLFDFPPVELIILDTLASYLPRVASTDNVHVRQMLQPLVDLAERYQVAIVAINHLNKSSQQAGQYRPMGSLAFTAVPRAVWGLTRDPHDFERRLFLPVKMNLGPTPTGLAFRTEGMKIVWEEKPLTSTWTGALKDSTRRLWRERLVAIAFLEERLAAGPLPVKQIAAEAKEAMISPGTLRRAMCDLQIETYPQRVDDRKCNCWALPQHAGLPPVLRPPEPPPPAPQPFAQPT